VPQLGRQPGIALSREERWSLSALARRLDVPLGHLTNAMHGRAHPSDAIRDRLPAVVGRPLSELFTQEALARAYSGPRGNMHRRLKRGAR
jgi:transcriptional regulator with XRE-family HTH domain